MRLVSFTINGRPSFGLLVDDKIVDLGDRMADSYPSVKALLEQDALREVEQAVTGVTPDLSLHDVALRPPVPDSAKILCVGLNYHEHAEESEAYSPGSAGATSPTVFSRFTDSQVGHGVPIVKPSVSDAFDYEGELVVIMGKPLYHAEPDDVFAAIAGYSVYNDGSARDWQSKSTQWQPGKNFPASGACGPALVTIDEVPAIEDQVLSTTVNGELRQRAAIRDLVHDIPTVVSFISQFTPLSPGDAIVTGTPGGAGAFREPRAFLQAGDVVEVEVTGVGVLTNRVVDEE